MFGVQFDYLQACFNLRVLYCHNNQLTSFEGARDTLKLFTKLKSAVSRFALLFSTQLTGVWGLFARSSELYAQNNQITNIADLNVLKELQKL